MASKLQLGSCRLYSSDRQACSSATYLFKWVQKFSASWQLFFLLLFYTNQLICYHHPPYLLILGKLAGFSGAFMATWQPAVRNAGQKGNKEGWLFWNREEQGQGCGADGRGWKCKKRCTLKTNSCCTNPTAIQLYPALLIHCQKSLFIFLCLFFFHILPIMKSSGHNPIFLICFIKCSVYFTWHAFINFWSRSLFQMETLELIRNGNIFHKRQWLLFRDCFTF